MPQKMLGSSASEELTAAVEDYVKAIYTLERA